MTERHTQADIANSPSYTRSPPARQEPLLEVQSWGCVTENRYIHGRGEVKNVSARPLKNVQAVGTLRNAAGELVKTESSLIDYNPIMPGQTSPFEALGPENPAITNCNLSFKHLFGGEIAYTLIKNNIISVQELLNGLGYAVGAVDGSYWAKNDCRHQRFPNNGMDDGGVTEELISKLRAADKKP